LSHAYNKGAVWYLVQVVHMLLYCHMYLNINKSHCRLVIGVGGGGGQGDAITWVIRCWLNTMKFWTQFWITSCKICDRWSGIGKGFCLEFFSILFHNIVPPCLHMCLSPPPEFCNSYNQTVQDTVMACSLNLGLHLSHRCLASPKIWKLIPVFKVCLQIIMSHFISTRRLDCFCIIWPHNCSLQSNKLLKNMHFNIIMKI
jgi:hypothetical protein